MEVKAMRSRITILAGISFGLFTGWVLFPMVLYRSEEQPQHFSHLTHTGEKAGMACVDCHTTSDEGRFQGIPGIVKCAECHASPIGESHSEQELVSEYIVPNKEIPWQVYSRQPDNVFFSHAPHVARSAMACTECHGDHGVTDQLRPYEENRLSGYSRDIWGSNISGLSSEPWNGMKMDKCVRCHAGRQQRNGCIACHQ